ncbi:MAG: S46 family peptidase [Acidobacteria bacterium]|nr:S46 family peptidase [Acidobacteriota bacterium]
MKAHRSCSLIGILICLTAVLLALPASAEEGMWTFDNPPAGQLQEKYGFTITQQWLDHVRLSSVRFNDGGSGSFVSPRGLVLTNHHVALGQLQKVSTPEKDYATDGFYARSAAEEMKCPDLELNILESMEDMTRRVQDTVKRGMKDKDALAARKAEIANIEKESLDSTGLRSEVVTLYAGGEYWLYRYKKYVDVRLVFAPEQQAAFFGGDLDNFTYPRYDLDMALFRVYENDKPVESRNFLKLNPRGAQEGELVFVSGNPGSTERLSTLKEIEVQRDVIIPDIIKLIRRRLDVLKRYAEEGKEQARQAASQTYGLENSLKVYLGEYEGLLNKNLIAKKQKEETGFRAKITANPESARKYGKAWDEIAAAQQKLVARYKESRYRSLRASRLASLALSIVQYVAEINKPDGKREDGYHDSQLESLRFQLFSPAPVYPQMEIRLLENSLQEAMDELGSGDPFVKSALNGRTPAEAAKQVIEGTRLDDPAFRKELVDGGQAAVNASTDPAIVFARSVDPAVREIRKWFEDNVESIMTSAGEKIGQARFAVYGKSTYPDATFTLRLGHGTVRGYAMNGTEAPPKTTFYGLYDRSIGFGGKFPFQLPSRYVDRRDKVNLSTPLNFVCTCDTTGGSSGSPVISKEGEFVGVIFDGNIESLVGNYVYNEENNRSVAVHAGAMIEALRNLYDAADLANEMTNYE